LLHSADLHSRVWPFRERVDAFEAALGLGRAGALVEVGGFARLATLLERERAAGAALWLDSGDVLEGAPVFERFGGRIERELLGGLGLSAMALGNHELSLGGDELWSWIGAASFPVLAVNLAAATRSVAARPLQSSVLLDASGAKLAIIGVANPSSPPHLATQPNPWGFALAPDLAGAVQAEIDRLAPQADLVLVLSHLGLDSDRELVRETTGIDLVLGGHQHVVTREPVWQDDCQAPALTQRRDCVPRRVALVHSGAYGRFVTRLELEAEPATVGWGSELTGVRLVQLPLSAEVPESPAVVGYLSDLGLPAPLPLACLPAGLSRRSAVGGDSPLGNLTADAVREATGADVALLNGSALRADLEPGLLLETELSLALPFAEPWLSAWLSGKQLRAGLERAARRSAARDCESVLQLSGLQLELHCQACRRGAEDCLRMTHAGALAGALVRDDELLSVALPRYLTLAGGDFADVVGQPLSDSLSSVLASYVERQARDPKGASCSEPEARGLPVVRGGRDGRIVALP
jgi:5'-nucleotidase